MRSEYEMQVRLLLDVLPSLNKAEMFALKGGTAINFFIQDFPRLSVDIDLTYIPINSREVALKGISNGINELSKDIKQRLPGANITPQSSGGTVSKLVIWKDNAQIKLEVNTVLRGSIFEPIEMELSSRLQNEFERFVAVQVMSESDIYGGKLCAALDRQHPRDLFDVKILLETEGITDEIKTAFLGYLISHSRPMNEILNPNRIGLEEIYWNEFEGMTEEVDILEDLKDVQDKLPSLISEKLTDSDREFLLSFKKGEPNWELISIPHLNELPGVQWKLLNIKKMNKEKHQEAYRKLDSYLST
ncbi:nucleotidyl transferase AbiEii/AbiGii toxin family protein [Gracilimonas sediminicola]|uniref:nucleotidyl transferase AbiEii/AbiGii toxin family protein n=1 Tax=Gracilimonas sediminicola TaxID=2952158 RepID=UPI0038D39BA4